MGTVPWYGKGILYFGVNDSGLVIGQTLGKDTLRNISRDIAAHIKPSCWYEVDAKKTETGEIFIEINFSGDDAPYSAYGRYYERFADEDRAVSDTELEKMFRSRRKDYSDWENSPSGEPLSSVDEDLLKSIINSGNEKGRLKYKYTNKETVLSKLGLADIKTGILTNAGNVLLSQKAPVILKLATFSGTNKSSFKNLSHFEGNIFECIEEGNHYILDNISWEIEINGSAKREETPEIPAVAIREILINAFAHGFYGGNTTFEIGIFSDRVSIYSPGNFPRGYKPEDFSSMAEEPIMLNPKIVNVLFKVGEIESFGSGFERTFTACKKAGVKYEYADTGTGFRFTFFRPYGQRNVRKMSVTEKAVYEIIKDNVYVKTADIAKQINRSEKTVYRAVRRLKEDGLIAREGGAYNGKWVVKN